MVSCAKIQTEQFPNARLERQQTLFVGRDYLNVSVDSTELVPETAQWGISVNMAANLLLPQKEGTF
jgi:hypothetical protein